MSTAPADITAQFAALEHHDEQRRARLSAPDAVANAATWYAQQGWPVFPLKPQGKTPLTRNGFKDASTDLEQIRAWWTTTPQANIGTPTGLRFDVVDVDGPPDPGLISLSVLRHAECPPGCCNNGVCWPDRSKILGHDVLADAATGGSGRHILITPTGQSNGTEIMPGIDYRGLGGYIVLPPSLHESGNRYDWITPPDARLLEAAA